MLGFLAAVPRFGVQPTRQRVLECLLRAEMYLVDTIVHFSAGKHDAVRGFAAFLRAEVRQTARCSEFPGLTLIIFFASGDLAQPYGMIFAGG